MDIAQLLAQFSDPDVIKTLSAGQRMMGGLAATVLGMGITFAALIILQFVMVIMEKFTVSKPVLAVKAGESVPEQVTQEDESSVTKDEELVAVLTTAIAMKLQTASSNIIIRNIEKIEDTTSAWNRAGITEQMNSRF